MHAIPSRCHAAFAWVKGVLITSVVLAAVLFATKAAAGRFAEHQALVYLIFAAALYVFFALLLMNFALDPPLWTLIAVGLLAMLATDLAGLCFRDFFGTDARRRGHDLAEYQP